MAFLPESPAEFPAGVYQLETVDPVEGGAAGKSNVPLIDLANRTRYLKDQIGDDVVTARAGQASLSARIDQIRRHARVAAGAGYNVVLADIGKVIDCFNVTGTINLPAVGTVGEGFYVYIRNSGGGVITVDPSGAELINTQTSIKAQIGVTLKVWCDSAAWKAIAVGLATNDDGDLGVGRATVLGIGAGIRTFSVEGPTGGGVRMRRNDDTVDAYCYVDGTRLSIGTITAHELGLYTSNALRLRLSNNGDAFFPNDADAMRLGAPGYEFKDISAYGVFVKSRGVHRAHGVGLADRGGGFSVLATYSSGLSTPSGVCYVPSTDTFWICNAGGTTVTVLRATDLALIATIGLGSAPSANSNPLWVPAYDRVYIGLANGNVVSVAAQTYGVVGTIVTGGHVTVKEIVYSPMRNRVYAVAEGNGGAQLGSVTVINPATDAVVAVVTANCPASPRGAAYCDSTDQIFLSSTNNTFGVFDCATGAFTGAPVALGTGSLPYKVIWVPKLNRILMNIGSSGDMVAIRPVTLAQTNYVAVTNNTTSLLYDPVNDRVLQFYLGGVNILGVNALAEKVQLNGLFAGSTGESCITPDGRVLVAGGAGNPVYLV